MKSIRSRKKSLQKACKAEKNANVRIRILFVIYVWIDGMKPSEAARRLKMSRAWGSKWTKRYREGGLAGLRDLPRSGRPPKVHPGIMKKVRRIARDTMCWTVEGMHKHILKNTGVDYSASHVRKIMKKWGYTMKVPVGRHVNRASKRRIRRFQKKVKGLEALTAEGWVMCVQDETIVIADVRLRKGVYTLKKKRAVYKYTGNHAKIIEFGLLTADGRGYFEGHKRFTKDEFVAFLRNAHAKFGKMVIILDRAPQHTAKVVQEAIDEMDGEVKLVYLPPGCPDLNAMEELWRQMKRAVLSGPYVKFSKMCRDIKRWLRNKLPRLDIFRYLYRSV